MNTYLLAFCSKSWEVQLMLLLKIFFKLACIIAPLVIIFITIIGFVGAVTSGKEEDLKENGKKLVKRLIAGLLIMFIPTIISFVFTKIVDGNGNEMIACFETATKERVASLKQKEAAMEDAEKKAQQILDEKTLKEAYEKEQKQKEKQKKFFLEARERYRRSQNSVSIANGDLFTPETKAIIEKHQNDFDYSNFRRVINSYGGFQGYVNELGGIFKKYYGKDVPPVECASDLQEVSEYVFGFMYLYGFDYYNGQKYCKWGGECGGSSAAPDAFYPSGVKHNNDGLSSPKNDFDKIVAGTKKENMTLNCNWTVDMVYYKAGLFGHAGQPTSSASFKSMGKNYKIIANAADVQVGDIVHFFRSNINKNDPSTWHDWYHVAFIGEVNKTEGYVVGYDGGSYYTNRKNFKWKDKIASGEFHGTKNWVAVRIADINQTC